MKHPISRRSLPIARYIYVYTARPHNQDRHSLVTPLCIYLARRGLYSRSFLSRWRIGVCIYTHTHVCASTEPSAITLCATRARAYPEARFYGDSK